MIKWGKPMKLGNMVLQSAMIRGISLAKTTKGKSEAMFSLNTGGQTHYFNTEEKLQEALDILMLDRR